MSRTSNFIDYTNQKIGSLLFLNYVGKSKWECICDCGHKFIINSQSIRKQNQRRCKYCFYKTKKKHGISCTPEFQAWQHIKERCYNKENRMYKNYGGRGIKMCDRWIGDNGAYNFFIDLGKRPSSTHSIDRINVDGDYEPNNCRWATKHEQMRNRTNNVVIEYNNEKMILTDWAKRLKISRGCLISRLKDGWSIEEAFNTPTIKHGFTRKSKTKDKYAY